MLNKKKNSIFSYFPLLILLFVIITLFLGILTNTHSDKLMKVSLHNLNPTAVINPLISKLENCSPLLLSLYQEEYLVCCDENDLENSWECLTVSDNINKIFSTKYAFILPLLPLFFTIFADILISISLFLSPIKLFSYTNSNIFSSDSQAFLSLFFNGKSKKEYLVYFLVSLYQSVKRSLVYFCIIIYRVVFIYFFFMHVEKLFNYLFPSSHIPWCTSVLSSKRCKADFDFSDHIALSLVQYIVPAVLEALYLIREIKKSFNKKKQDKNDQIHLERHPEYSPSHPDSIKYDEKNRIYSLLPSSDLSFYFPLRGYLYIFLPLFSCILMIFLQLRMIFSTISLFHTHLESIVGSLVGILLGIFPLLFNFIQEKWSFFN